MKRSFNSAINFIVNKHMYEPGKLNEILFKVVVIGFSIGLMVVVDTILYGFFAR